MSRKNENGSLTVFTGPMFSRKTTHLIEQAKLTGDAGILFKPSMDDRYGGGQKVHSHDGESHEATLFNAKNPQEILAVVEKMPELAMVLIDEIQFCSEEIIGVIEKLLVQGLDVMVAGLNLDYKKDDFGPMGKIIEMAERVVYSTARCDCDGCEIPATLTYARGPMKDIVKVGGENFFGAACSDCHDKLRGDLNVMTA